jgi:hypothetical protein
VEKEKCMKRILIVGLLAAALFAYLEYSPKTKIENIVGFSVNEVSLVKEGDSWKLKDNPEIPVNEATVNSVISGIESIPLGDPIPDMNLPEPVSLTLKISYNGKDEELVFGKDNDFLSKTYLKFKDKVYLVPNFISKSLDKKMDDFREKKLIRFFLGDLSKITLKKGSESIVLESKDGWRVVEPVSGKASETKLRELVSELRDLSADELEFGEKIEDPDLEVEVVRTDGTLTTIRISRASDSEPSKTGDEPILFSVSGYNFLAKTRPNPIQRIFKPVNDFREKAQFSFNPSDVKRLEVSGSHSLVVERAGDGFLVDGKNGDTAFVNEYLSTLAGLSAVDFPTASLPTNELKFKLIFEDGSEKILEIGSFRDKGRPAKAEELFFISEDSYKKIVPRLEQLLPAK